MGEIDLSTPDWSLQVELDGKVVTTTVHDTEDLLPHGEVPVASGFCVAGTPTAGTFLYLVQLDRKRVKVIYRGPSPSPTPAAGVSASSRVPNSGWLIAPVTGAVRVVEAARPIGADEWVALMHGRDPPPKGTSSTNSGPVKPKKPAPPKDPKSVAGRQQKTDRTETRRPRTRPTAATKAVPTRKPTTKTKGR